jgi:hypothetical protein
MSMKIVHNPLQKTILIVPTVTSLQSPWKFTTISVLCDSPYQYYNACYSAESQAILGAQNSTYAEIHLLCYYQLFTKPIYHFERNQPQREVEPKPISKRTCQYPCSSQINLHRSNVGLQMSFTKSVYKNCCLFQRKTGGCGGDTWQELEEPVGKKNSLCSWLQ